MLRRRMRELSNGDSPLENNIIQHNAMLQRDVINSL